MANVSGVPDAVLVLSNISTPVVAGLPGLGNAPEAFPLAVTVISALIMSLAAVVGTFSNVLVILAVCVSKDLQNVRSAFIVNMAIADLQVTAIADPFSAIAKVKGRPWFDARPGLCDALGTFCTMICVTSLLSLAGVSLNRYIHICHFRLYDRIFTLRKTLLMCLCCWIIGGALVAPNHFGWGDLNFDSKSLGCMFDRTADYSYTAFFMLFLVGSPLVLIAHSFVRIYMKVQKTRIQLAGHGSKSSRMDSIKLAKTLFVVFLSFTICWLPFMLTQVIDKQNQLPAWFYLWVTIQAHLHSSFNGLLYCITNLKFRKAYAKVLCLERWLGHRRVWPGTPTATHTVTQTGTLISTVETTFHTVTGRMRNLEVPTRRDPDRFHSVTGDEEPAKRRT